MAHKILTATAALLFATSALAQEKPKTPEMTPEQKAEMEAYMQAGTPGAPHQMLASTAGRRHAIRRRETLSLLI